MTEQKLLDYLLAQLPVWKERLGLQYWETDLHIERRDEMDGNQGQCTYNGVVLYADIRILSPIDWKEYHSRDTSEATLVHELIHLLFWQLCPEKDTPEFVILEQGITRLERALMAGWNKRKSHIRIEATV